MLKTENIFKTYDDNKAAIENINFEIQEGKIIGLAGPSGSGKSTLLKIIAGLLEPTTGKVWFEEKRVLMPSEKLVAGHDDIKLVYQNNKLFPNQTIKENIEYYLRRFPKTFIETRTNFLLDAFKIAHIANHIPAQVSGGELQRAAICTALANPPKLLLLDEPFSSLDPILRDELSEIIFDFIKQENITTIFTDHNPETILSYSDYIILIHNGKLSEQGLPIDLFNHPKNLFSAQFWGYKNVITSSQLKKLNIKHSQSKSNKFLIKEVELLQENGDWVCNKSLFKGHFYEIKFNSLIDKTVEIVIKTNYQIQVKSTYSLKFNNIIAIT